MSQLSMNSNCTVIDETTGQQCPCLKATLPDTPERGVPLRCLECLHGPSLHCGNRGTYDGHSHGEAGRKKSVKDIIEGLVSSSSTAGGTRKPRLLSFKDANNEANSGLVSHRRYSLRQSSHGIGFGSQVSRIQTN
jgi:hypothetical protein